MGSDISQPYIHLETVAQWEESPDILQCLRMNLQNFAKNGDTLDSQ